MKIKNIRTVAGPNTFHRNAVLIMTLDLQERADTGSHELPGFKDRLLALIPGLKEHRCSPGYPGGFVERLDRGTYFAHIIEHVALELSGPAGIEVGFGKSVYGGEPGIYQVVVRFRSEKAMRFLLESAVGLVEACAESRSFDVEPVVERARRLAEEEKLGPSTQAIVDAAVRRGIPWRRVNEESLIEFGYGSKRKRIQATITGESSHIAVDIAQDKDLTKSMLERMGLPVPKGLVVSTCEEAIDAFRRFDAPVALKPYNGNHGNGVSLNLTSEAAVFEAYEVAREYSRTVIVEEYFRGKDYRAVVVGGKLVAVAERTAAHVYGDGKHTVSELIEIENRNPLRGEGHEKPMTKIGIDRAAAGFLVRSGINLESVPAEGQFVPLRNTANLSKGGTAIDVTDFIHPDNVAICERAARTIALDVCGIDLIAEDISKPLSEQVGGIIEVNAAPGIRMHHFPLHGTPRDVGGAIIDHLFPAGETGRIPIVSITGTNGKTTVTRMIGHLFNEARQRVGMTTSSGIFLGDREIARGDTTGPASARMILEDPWVDVAVLETARGGIVRRGLGYDWSDVGVLTNVQPDHIGQDGIESVEDILRIKSLVAERVREGGTLVLNAEDTLVASIAENPTISEIRRNVVFFGLSEKHPVLVRQIERGGTAYFVRDGMMVESRGGRERVFGPVAAIPLTIFGTADYQIANALASAAAARAMGLRADQVWAGLLSFAPIANNSGRGNFYRVEKGIVMVDYGHNPEALRAVTRMSRQWNAPRVTGIISAPGDRSDEMIKQSGYVAAEGFDRIIIREDVDLRGRDVGETARILCEAVHEVRPDAECTLRLSEPNALESAVKEMLDGEVVVFFYDDLELVKSTLARVGAAPIHDLQELSGLMAPRAELPAPLRGRSSDTRRFSEVS